MKKDKFIYEAPSAEITALLVRAGLLLDASFGDEGAAGADAGLNDDENDYGSF